MLSAHGGYQVFVHVPKYLSFPLPLRLPLPLPLPPRRAAAPKLNAPVIGTLAEGATGCRVRFAILSVHVRII